MPFAGPWRLDDQLLHQAHEAGRLNEWEFEFYKGNYGNRSISEKQELIKRRIEQMTLPSPWFLQGTVLQVLVRQGSITPWEMRFYLSNATSRRITTKQAVVKFQTEDKVELED